MLMDVDRLADDPEPSLNRLDVEGYLEAQAIGGDAIAEQLDQPAFPVGRDPRRFPDSLIEFPRQPAGTASSLSRGQHPELVAFATRAQAGI